MSAIPFNAESAYREIKDDIREIKADNRALAAELSSVKTWIVSLFIGSILVMSALTAVGINAILLLASTQ